MTNPTFDILLEKLTYGGEAMGRLPDGRAYSCHLACQRTCPRGVDRRQEKFARGKLLEILKASPKNRTKCKHFGKCGGCHYQICLRKTIISKDRDSARPVAENGKIENPPIAQIVASPLEWNYRNHVQFILQRRERLGYKCKRKFHLTH